MLTADIQITQACPNSFTVFAELIRPIQAPNCPKEMESLTISATFQNNGQRIRPRLDAVVGKHFPKWQLSSWWMPEPANEF